MLTSRALGAVTARCCEAWADGLVMFDFLPGLKHMGKADVGCSSWFEALEGRWFFSATSVKRAITSSQPLRKEEDYRAEALTSKDVRVVLAQAASQALPG